MARPTELIKSCEEYCAENPICQEGFGSRSVAPLLAYIRRIEADNQRLREEMVRYIGIARHIRNATWMQAEVDFQIELESSAQEP